MQKKKFFQLSTKTKLDIDVKTCPNVQTFTLFIISTRTSFIHINERVDILFIFHGNIIYKTKMSSFTSKLAKNFNKTDSKGK